ncbi:c-type cytochrome [bacterium]|nr:c-type cytochrome [bacterium]
MKQIFLLLLGAFSLGQALAGANVEELVADRCATCHGAQGQYIAKQLGDFKAGKRVSDTMAPQVADLSADDFTALATFFSTKPARVNRVADEDLLPVGRYIYAKGNSWSGVPACAGCHGETGHGTAQLPRLAGQNGRYLLTQLKEFTQRTRTNDNAAMHLVASRLTEMEAKAVSDYLSQLP